MLKKVVHWGQDGDEAEKSKRRLQKATGCIAHQTIRNFYVAFYDDETRGKAYAFIRTSDILDAAADDPIDPKSAAVALHSFEDRKVVFDAEKLWKAIMLDSHFCRFRGYNVSWQKNTATINPSVNPSVLITLGYDITWPLLLQGSRTKHMNYVPGTIRRVDKIRITSWVRTQQSVCDV